MAFIEYAGVTRYGFEGKGAGTSALFAIGIGENITTYATVFSAPEYLSFRGALTTWESQGRGIIG